MMMLMLLLLGCFAMMCCFCLLCIWHGVQQQPVLCACSVRAATTPPESPILWVRALWHIVRHKLLSEGS